MRQTVAKDSPSRQHITLAAAYDHFNRRLFSGELPPALVTMQRRRGGSRARGFYSPGRYEARDDPGRGADEIALNPTAFAGRSDADILSTLVHEMVHHWQRHFGKPGRGPYHNRQWADKMEEVGLTPSDTGRPGGMRTGDGMTHYRTPGGVFDKACEALLAGGVKLEWQSKDWRAGRSKTKYTCPKCSLNAWAKPGVALMCGGCMMRMAERGAK